MLRRIAKVAVSMCFTCFASLVGAAQPDFPTKAITIIVPWPPGGAADFLARVVGQRMSEKLSVPVLVENRPGAATNIGTQAVARADPDGYTLLMASSNNCVNVTLYPNLKFDFAKAFKPITNVGLAPNILVVHPSVPAHNTKDLIELAKAKPGTLTYGSSGNGSASHLAAEMFKTQAKVDILNVPYKGAAPAATDLLAGQLSMMFTVVPATISSIRAQKLRILGVASNNRLAIFPNVPTIAESGLPGFQSSIWYGLVAPAGTPDSVVGKLQETISGLLKEEAIAAKLIQQGTIPIGDSSAEFAKTISHDVQTYGALVRSANIRTE